MTEARPLGNPVDSVASQPAREIYSAKLWSKWIKRSFDRFDGDLEKAALLMESFCKGMNYVYSRLVEGKLDKVVKPRVAIVISGGIGSYVGYAEKQNLLLVQKTFLEQASLYDIRIIGSIVRDDVRSPLTGRILDFFSLYGVEEAHHSVFRQIKKEKDRGSSVIGKGLTEYDAQNVEYRALKWQFKYAQEQNMPRVTIARLQERLDNACNERYSKKPTI